jgi:choline dehydrogenase
VNGPVGVRVKDQLDPLSAAFLEAGRQAGHPFTEDVNGASLEGVCRFDMNVDRGYRASSAYAYLERRRHPGNLEVLLHATAARLAIERGRCVGVDVMVGGRGERLRAREEVVLSAGAIGSAKLLMLSGIGDEEALRGAGIRPVRTLRGVGRNLHDHLELDLQWSAPSRHTFNRLMRPHRMAAIGLQWLLFKRGFGATNQVYVGAFLRSNPDVAYANIQFHFVPVYMDGWLPTARRSGFRIGAGPTRPSSRGFVALRSADPRDAVILDPNYLATEDDRRQMRESYDLIHGIVAQRAFDPFRGPPIDPPDLPTSKEAIDAMVRRYMGAGFHLCGTCRMGRHDDPEAVVDNAGRVLGIEALRVVDASIMPSIVTGNPNATVMMMAERLSDSIRGRPFLPPDPGPPGPT